MISSLAEAMECARGYLSALEQRRLVEAQSFLAPRPALVFPGNRVLASAAAIAAGSAGRYRRVAKQIEIFEGFEARPGRWIIYCHGTLYGEWTDGSSFSGIRFIDRFEVDRDGIQRQDVWNDAGEARLARTNS